MMQTSVKKTKTQSILQSHSEADEHYSTFIRLKQIS